MKYNKTLDCSPLHTITSNRGDIKFRHGPCKGLVGVSTMTIVTLK